MELVRIKKRNIPPELLPFFKKYKEGDRWRLRNVIVWEKPNAMPSSVKDRFSVNWEPVFFFSKQKSYWFEPQYEQYTEPMNRWGGDELKADGKSEWDEGTGQDTYRDRNMRPNTLGRNKRAVWKIPTAPFKEAHFATFPEKLIEPMIKAGCPEFICKKCGKAREKIIDTKYELAGGKTESEKYHGEKLAPRGQHGKPQEMKYGRANAMRTAIGYTDCGCSHKEGWDKGIVLDPFMGSGTTAVVARKLSRNYIGIELSKNYVTMAEKRLAQGVLL